MPQVTTNFNILNNTLVYSKSETELLFVYNHLLHKQCQQIGLRQRQQMILFHLGYFACNNIQMAIWNYQIIMHDMHQAKMYKYSDIWHGPIHIQGIIAILHQKYFQVLSSLPTLPRSTWQQVYQYWLVHPKDIRYMSHHDKHMICHKKTMVDLECSPLSSSQDMGHHLQIHF